MPYTVSDLKSDSRFKGLPAHALEIFAAAFNAALKTYEGDESKAFDTAWAAVRHKYTKRSDGRWVAMSVDFVPEDEAAALDAVTQFMAGIKTEEVIMNIDTAVFAVTRRAKLFEAGSYPDRDIEVTEADMDTWVTAHASGPPIPVKLEHMSTVLDGALATAKGLFRKGKELFCDLDFTDAAWDLVKDTAKALSVAIKRDKSGIAEVSLVREPRIADARVFAEDCVGFSMPLEAWQGGEVFTPQEVKIIMPTAETTINTEVPDITLEQAMAAIERFRKLNPDVQAVRDANNAVMQMKREQDEMIRQTGAQAQAMMKAVQEERAKGDTDRLFHDGKFIPAVREIVFALLSLRPLHGGPVPAEQLVTFGEGDAKRTVSVGDLVFELLEKNKEVIDFKEYQRADASENAPSPETVEVFSKIGADINSPIAKRVLAESRR